MSESTRSFGPYQLVRRLGMGGMAETFEAVRLGPGGFEQRVCVKRILPAFEQDELFVRLFLEEARIAARLRHANIVQVIDFGVAEGSHYLALELVLGCDLRELLRAERAEAAASSGGRAAGLTSGLVVFLAQELAVALEIAHGGTEMIVHRDISPANVLLSTAGEVKLSDFGIARAINEQRAAATNTIKGKVPYMAPEYALHGCVDHRVDLFALGVLLYECLAGARPFDGKCELDTLTNLTHGTHIALRERCPDAPSPLIDLIEQLILPDPEQRIQSAAALLEALVDLAPPPTARHILGKLVTHTRATRAGRGPRGAAADALARAALAQPPNHAPATTAPLSASGQPTTSTEVLPDTHRDVRPRPALPFATAASTDPTRTATPESALPEADTHAPRTRTLVDPAPTSSPAADSTHAQPAETPPDAHPEPTSGGTFEPSEVTSATPPAKKRRAPLGLVALGSVALLGSTALALFLVLSWHAAPAPGARKGAAHALSPTPTVVTPARRTTSAATPRSAPSAAQLTAAQAPPPPAAAQGRPLPALARPLPRPDAAGAPPLSPRAVAQSPSSAPPTSAAHRVESAPRRDARATTPTSDDDLTTHALLSILSEGDIYLDGRRVGFSSVTVSVPPGRHVVAGGAGDNATSLTVDLGRGERRRVVLR